MDGEKLPHLLKRAALLGDDGALRRHEEPAVHLGRSHLALHVEGVVGTLDGHVEAALRDLASEGEYHVAHGERCSLSAFRISNEHLPFLLARQRVHPRGEVLIQGRQVGLYFLHLRAALVLDAELVGHRPGNEEHGVVGRVDDSHAVGA